MSIVDYDALLDTIYSIQGLAAKFLSRDGKSVDLTVMDKTGGVELPGGPMLTEALRPAVMVRGSELTSSGLDPGRLRDGRVTLTEKGTSWNVEATRPKPKPNGGGEYYLFLQERNDG